MANPYLSRRGRDPFAKLYFPAIVLLGLGIHQQLGEPSPPDTAAPSARPAPYIRMQSRSDAGDTPAERDTGTSPFRNCTQARAAGHEDIPDSSPLYGAHMDGDHDGLACEPVKPRRR